MAFPKRSLFVLLLGLSACGKKDGEPAAADKLRAGSWQLVSWSSKRTFRNDSVRTDVYAQTKPCVRDNRYTFGKDSRLRLDEGAARCAPNDAQTTDAGAYFVVNGGRQLQSALLGFPSTATIDELSDAALQLTTDTTFYFGGLSSRLVSTARFER